MSKINLTDTMLDRLGFGDYDDENGDSGTRRISFECGLHFRVWQTCEMDDDSYGYGTPLYQTRHFYYSEGSDYSDLFFLHELYQVVKNYYPACLEEFVERCKKANMGPWIERHLKGETV